MTTGLQMVTAVAEDRESHLTQNWLSQENLLKHTQYVSVNYILGQLQGNLPSSLP